MPPLHLHKRNRDNEQQPAETFNDGARPEEVSRDEHYFEYNQLKDPDLRYKYVRFTEGLIAKTISEQKDVLIFLDKSARPVAWLMKALWPTLGFEDFDDAGSPIPAPMPDIKFVNIDREQWGPMMGRSEVKDGHGISAESVPRDTIDSLTGLFAEKAVEALEDVSADDPTMFDGKNILIVDEVGASGDTLHMSEALFERAFKHAKDIDGTYWMTPDKRLDEKSGGMRNADLPIWYDENSLHGRLVSDRNFRRSDNSPSIRQRRGSQFLSTPFKTRDGKTIPDTRGIQLREEMFRLGEEVARGAMPVIYDAAYRPDSDEFAENFMQHVNQLSIDEFAALRQQAEVEQVSFPELVYHYKLDRQRNSH